jgi:hypothetical protein
VEGRRTAGAAEQASATIRNRRIWRAKAAMGSVIRNALARAGVDAAQGFAGAPPPDFANALFAELFAWALAQPPAE